MMTIVDKWTRGRVKSPNLERRYADIVDPIRPDYVEFLSFIFKCLKHCVHNSNNAVWVVSLRLAI